MFHIVLPIILELTDVARQFNWQSIPLVSFATPDTRALNPPPYQSGLVPTKTRIGATSLGSSLELFSSLE